MSVRFGFSEGPPKLEVTPGSGSAINVASPMGNGVRQAEHSEAEEGLLV
jgi:hypothetical protein